MQGSAFHNSCSGTDYARLAAAIKSWGKALGFQEIGIADTELGAAELRLLEWLEAGCHGEMDYMAKHGAKRSRPAELLPGTVRVISARINYQPPRARDGWKVLADPNKAYISRYATGRDYHKVLRRRLQILVDKIHERVEGPHCRVFTDSAPVMEVELARKAGLGWRGKHTLLLTRETGSWFFLGEIYTDLPLPVDGAQQDHCGTCEKCIEICPTRAIVAPYKLDARRCISYLTIEHKGSIPVELRPLLGNRVYGCDDCQLICPWNRYATSSPEEDFQVRHGLDDSELIELFNWSENDFHEKLAGSAIHRIGYERWLRNLAVGLGNAPRSSAAIETLQRRLDYPSDLVREHAQWALNRQRAQQP